jgi:beta-glucanase (GH16 family)
MIKGSEINQNIRYVITPLFILLLIACSSAPFYPPASKTPPNMTFYDEFSGNSLDENKWDVYNNQVYPFLNSCMSNKNISVSNGILHLLAKKEDCMGMAWSTAYIQTRFFRQQYGYFEARYKYLGAADIDNAFWLMTLGDKLASDHIEIDINEGFYPNLVMMNIHLVKNGSPWSEQTRWTPPGNLDLSAEFHIYGLDWSENSLVWYFDGQEIRRFQGAVIGNEVLVMFSNGLTIRGASINDSLNGKSMDVDYVRVYNTKP